MESSNAGAQQPSKQQRITAKRKKLFDSLQLGERMPETTKDAANTSNVRVENCIGFSKIPVGLAGPLTIHGEHQQGTVHAPLATLEATLVASCSRGCKVFEKSGGVHAVALQEGMSRAPIFRFEDVGHAVAFYRAVPGFEGEIRDVAEKTSRWAKLLSLTPHIIGTCVHVKFTYSCGASAGQNMTTIATHKACQQLIAKRKDEFKIQGFLTEGQMASDKKLSWGNVASPRGVSAMAWVAVPNNVCLEVLGNDASNIYGTYLHGVQAGIRNGIQGYNINTANILAALFIACGQDAASVLEAGWAQLTLEFNDASNELLLSIFFPSLPVGTVGGGTGYPTQAEALGLLNCAGEGRKWAFAETIASFALALEISTLSAIANDTFSQSHRRLARL